jgi:hypothetical protein
MENHDARRKARARHQLHLTRWLQAAQAGALRRGRREVALAVRALDLPAEEAARRARRAQDAHERFFAVLDQTTVVVLVLVALLAAGAVL